MKGQKKPLLLPLEQLKALAVESLKPPALIPRGDERRGRDLDPQIFSKAIEAQLIAKLKSHVGSAWELSGPVALGSWSRHELCPRSDLDLLFAGDEGATGEVTAWAQQEGLAIRSRVPLDSQDWTAGVASFDMMSLLSTRSLVDHFNDKVDEQKIKLIQRLPTIRRALLKDCREERMRRSERHDSMENYLEPNLKYGPGGLRDLRQALQLRQAFPERFADGTVQRAEQILEYYRRFFLIVRMKAHLLDGGGDLLSAYDQAPMAQWFGFLEPREFMREIQKGLSRVSFYADWTFERCRQSSRRIHEVDRMKAKDFVELADWLKQDPSLLVQARAREEGFDLYQAGQAAGEALTVEKALGKLVQLAIDPASPEPHAVALFRARWIDFAVTDFKKIVGHVQHDQYHRYTVDAHLLQALRELKRIYQRPSRLGRLKKAVGQLSQDDWQILGWSALYHDVGKGSGSDHSLKSMEIATQDLERRGVSPAMREEVLWLIENHLELSVAAFRGNPAEPQVWHRLHERGVLGQRLTRLLVFTAVDIRATNPDAYTPWKERLLFDLYQNLEKPEVHSLAILKEALKGDPSEGAVYRLDPFLVSSIPVRTLAKDIKLLSAARLDARTAERTAPGLPAEALSAKLFNLSQTGRLWVRFQANEDRVGLFQLFAESIQQVGLSVRHASLVSDDVLGVYDWVEVKPPANDSPARRKSIERRINQYLSKHTERTISVPAELARFNSIEVLQATDEQWVFSFKGLDKPGALRSAATALADLGLSVVWAKVHTWGRQMDDVFGLVAPRQKKVEDVLRSLRARLVT